MIIEFSVSNFLSFKEELKASFITTPLKEFLCEDNDILPLGNTGISLLRSAVIFGANASGKSNVLEALAFHKLFSTDSFKGSQAGE